MSVFASIKQGLAEATAHAKGEPVGVVEYCPQAVDAAGLRRRLGLSQGQFAARFGFSVATLRHWERGDRKPQGAALVLLNAIDRNPKTTRRPGCGVTGLRRSTCPAPPLSSIDRRQPGGRRAPPRSTR